jgi:hypothetical protein
METVGILIDDAPDLLNEANQFLNLKDQTAALKTAAATEPKVVAPVRAP